MHWLRPSKNYGGPSSRHQKCYNRPLGRAPLQPTKGNFRTFQMSPSLFWGPMQGEVLGIQRYDTVLELLINTLREEISRCRLANFGTNGVNLYRHVGYKFIPVVTSHCCMAPTVGYWQEIHPCSHFTLLHGTNRGLLARDSSL